MTEQRQYRTVTLKLWDEQIQLSYNFVRSTKLNDVFRKGDDISTIFTSDMSDKDSLVRELLLFFSDCYEAVIDNQVGTLLELLLLTEKADETRQLTRNQMVVIVNNVTTFFMLYENIFNGEDNVIFETYEDLEVFIQLLQGWMDLTFNITRMKSLNVTRLKMSDQKLRKSVMTLYNYMDNLLINTQQFYLSGERKTQRMTQALRSYKSPNGTPKREYESMRL